MEKVCGFQKDLINFLAEQSSSPKVFEKLREQLQLFTHHHLNEDELRHISKGIIYVTNRFLEVFQDKSLDTLYSSLQRTLDQSKNRKGQENNYWNTYWNETLKKINLKFLQSVFNKMAAIYTTYPEVVKDIAKEVEDEISHKNIEFFDLESKPQS